uniref:Immulectin 11 n=1 Tax=Hepialus xiaojinensis TaxID=1589740 RepID=A0A219YXH4_9NEOP|nr:immulectin 11 [Hepialus xiaojinensis]
MLSALFMIPCCLIATTNVVVAQDTDPNFRSDYKYQPTMAAFYKVHKSPKYWTEAVSTCKYEGGYLVVPESQGEIDFLVKLIENQLSGDTTGVFVGIHDMFIEGNFMTVKADSISDIFDNWAAGEPDDFQDNEDCVLLHRNSKYYDYDCKRKFPFICKKTLASLTANPLCGTSDKAYIPDVTGDKCYKLHLNPKTWSEAYTICHAEQSYLAVPTNKKESDLLKEMLAKHPENTLNDNFYKNGAYLGFHDQFTEGEYVTVFGEPLSQVSVAEWSPGQPDNGLNNDENCGHMFRDGLLNDVNCSWKLMFFCERQIGDDDVIDLFSRVQNNIPELRSLEGS